MKARRRSIVSLILLVGSSLLVVARPASATFPGAPGEIAYTATTDGHQVISATPPFEIAPYVLIDLGDRSASQAAWGPAGHRLAVTGEVAPGGPTAIFVADADGSNVHQVTFPSEGRGEKRKAR